MASIIQYILQTTRAFVIAHVKTHPQNDWKWFYLLKGKPLLYDPKMFATHIHPANHKINWNLFQFFDFLFSSWWFQLIWKILYSQIGSFPLNRDEPKIHLSCHHLAVIDGVKHHIPYKLAENQWVTGVKKPYFIRVITPSITSWWFQPVWKILVKLEIFPR